MDQLLVPAYAEIAARVPQITTIADVEAFRYAASRNAVHPAALAARFDVHLDAARLGNCAGYRAVTTGEVRARVVFAHGGGLIGGGPLDGLDTMLEYVNDVGLEVWSLEYPLAPEHSLDVAVAAVRQAIDALPSDLPIVLAGQSGGGGLVASVALDSADRLAGLMLLCPMLDVDSGSLTEREFADDACWSAASNQTAWSLALAGTDRQPPGRREILSLPPVYLDTSDHELFASDIERFASRARTVQPDTTFFIAEGGFHGSDSVVPDAASSIATRAARKAWLLELLGVTSSN